MVHIRIVSGAKRHLMFVHLGKWEKLINFEILFILKMSSNDSVAFLRASTNYGKNTHLLYKEIKCNALKQVVKIQCFYEMNLLENSREKNG